MPFKMANNQELRVLIAELTRQLERATQVLDRLERRGINQEEEVEPKSEDEESKEEQVEAEPAPEIQHRDGDAEVNQNLADLLGGLTFSHQSRSRVQVVNGEVLATGYGYEGNTYVSSMDNRWDMTRPPPGDCLKCGGNHWRKDCPLYHR